MTKDNDQRVSICPEGEIFPLPNEEDALRENERLHRLVAEQKALGREIVVVMGVGFVGAVMAGVVMLAVWPEVARWVIIVGAIIAGFAVYQFTRGS